MNADRIQLTLEEKQALALLLDGTPLRALEKVFAAEAQAWKERIVSEALAAQKDNDRITQYAARARAFEDAMNVIRSKVRSE